MIAYSAPAADECTQKPSPGTPVIVWPMARSTGVGAPVQIDWPTASTVTNTLSDFDPDVATTQVADPRRSARISPVASMLMSVGSRDTSTGAGVATLPNMSRLAAEIRAESTLTGIRTLFGDSESVA